MANDGVQISLSTLPSFPPEKQGTAMSVFGIAALIGPIVGPTLGGWLVVNFDWRWIFYINLPVGTVAFAAGSLLVEDPPYLKQERMKLLSKPLNFDYIGLGLLVLAVSCWEVLLSKGQEWDWLGDPFWRLQTLLILFGAGLLLFIGRVSRVANPLINLRVLGERNPGARTEAMSPVRSVPCATSMGRIVNTIGIDFRIGAWPINRASRWLRRVSARARACRAATSFRELVPMGW